MPRHIQLARDLRLGLGDAGAYRIRFPHHEGAYSREYQGKHAKPSRNSNRGLPGISNGSVEKCFGVAEGKSVECDYTATHKSNEGTVENHRKTMLLGEVSLYCRYVIVSEKSAE